MLEDGLLPDIPRGRIEAAFAAAPGNELASGKFASPESSSALVANGFGWFLERPDQLPCFVDALQSDWQVRDLRLEAEMRFPWSGGRHPWLDVALDLTGHLVGIESKRYEPFRSRKAPSISDAYFRDVWGEDMTRYGAVLQALRNEELSYDTLDAAQLVKHAYGLRTVLHREERETGTRRDGWLIYLYAEPSAWPDGRPVNPYRIAQHREEVAEFTDRVSGDEITFHAMTWRELLTSWEANGPQSLSNHAREISRSFAI